MVGAVPIGGGAPVSVQSMTKTDTRDIAATVAQIRELETVGCEIVRVAVPDMDAARAIGAIKKESTLPLVADIHFDYRLALEAARQGADKLRLNPGNIGAEDRVRAVVDAARERGLPIRIGVNAGSLEKELLARHGSATPDAMVESALRHIRILEDCDFNDIVVSMKAPDVSRLVAAYRSLAAQVDYPLHLGLTHAGTPWAGTIRSGVGLGILLSEGLGDTIRVSLTGSPVEEVRVGFEILRSLGLRERGRTIISCPTCGRMEIDLLPLVEEVERRTEHIREPITIAVMGCVVNGPGEAKEADVGIAGGKECALLFRGGEVLTKVSEAEIVPALMAEIDKVLEQRGPGKRETAK